MATGYIVSGLRFVLASNTTTTLITVPAGHKYIVKGLGGVLSDSAITVTITPKLSNTSGANPLQIAAAVTAGANVVNFQFAGDGDTLKNLVMEAGQILSISTSTSGTMTGQGQVSYVDYTI